MTILEVRSCAQCGGSMEGKRSHAVYCTRTCKTKASDARRIADGRSVARDRARYASSEGEHRRAYAMQYLRDNPERMRAIRRKRKGQLKARRYEFTERDWHRLLVRYNFSCAYCGAKGELHRDHVIPLCKGGNHSVGNILPACPHCNLSKKSRFLSDWRYRVLSKRLEVISRDSS